MLNFYSEPSELKKIDSKNTFSITFDGRVGGSQDRRIYIRNSNPLKWYDSIQIYAVDSAPISRVDNSNSGWAWKFAQKDIPLTNEEWAEILPGNSLSLNISIGNSTISDIAIYIPIWVRIEIPKRQRIQNITNIALRIEAREVLL